MPPGGVGRGFPYGDLVGQCTEFVEATGEVGDVYLLHPFVLHAKSRNRLRRPRFITNPPLALAEPMRFDRPDPSPVERAVLRALGVDSYAFAAAGPREEIVPERVARQRAMKADEDRRLAATEGWELSGRLARLRRRWWRPRPGSAVGSGRRRHQHVAVEEPRARGAGPAGRTARHSTRSHRSRPTWTPSSGGRGRVQPNSPTMAAMSRIRPPDHGDSLAESVRQGMSRYSDVAWVGVRPHRLDRARRGGSPSAPRCLTPSGRPTCSRWCGS